MLVFNVFALQHGFDLFQTEIVDVVVEGHVTFMINMVAEVLPVGAQMLRQLLQCQRVVLIVTLFFQSHMSITMNLMIVNYIIQ